MPTKSANNAIELNFVQFDSTNNKINFSVDIVSNGAPVAASVYDANSSSSGAFSLPTGTTQQRPSNPQLGSMRYNTSNNYVEIYSQIGWLSIGGSPVTISSVTPTNFNGNKNTEFSIIGTNFASDISVIFKTSGGTEYIAGTVTYANSTFVQATAPRNFSVSEGPLDIKIVQNGGAITTIKTSAIDCGNVPNWNTSSGTLETYYFANTASKIINNISLSASDPEGSPLTYSITSGSLPNNLQLGSSNGVIYGTLVDPGSSSVTTNFTVAANDSINQTTRSFSIIRKWNDGTSAEQAANSASAIKALTGTSTDGVFWLKFNSGNTTPFQVYCHMSGLDSGTDPTGGYILAATTTNFESNDFFLHWYKGDTSRSVTESSPNWFTADASNNLNLSTGANTVLQKVNYRGPAFTSYNFTDLLIVENISGVTRKKAYRLNATNNLRGWFLDTADHTTYTNRVSSIIGTTGSSGTGAIRSNTLDFNYYLTNDGARIATTAVSQEASGGWAGRVDTGSGTTNHGWQGNITRDDDGRIYSSTGRTQDHTWWIFVR